MDVGMIGFGAMGSAMAGHIIERRGHKVHAFDVDPARLEEARRVGAAPVASPAALGPLARLIIVMVATDEQARQVVRETSAAAQPGTLFAIASTIDPRTMTALDEIARETGQRVMDAPVCFGLAGAQEGALVSLCGGAAEDVEAARDTLLAYSRAVYHLGPLGSGQLAKTVNNLLHWSACVANFEALLLAKRYGLDAQKLRQVLLDCPADNGTLRRWDTTRFTWPAKDMDIALDLAQDGGLTLPHFGQIDQLVKLLTPDHVKALLYGDKVSYLGTEVGPIAKEPADHG
jgi:3-hydroxyisobutyrate dehydrogenase-like beta-hydroxyacid dehydrogenase